MFKFVSYNNLHKTNEFLDFVLKVRTQKCLIEQFAVDNGEPAPSTEAKKDKTKAKKW